MPELQLIGVDWRIPAPVPCFEIVLSNVVSFCFILYIVDATLIPPRPQLLQWFEAFKSGHFDKAKADLSWDWAKNSHGRNLFGFLDVHVGKPMILRQLLLCMFSLFDLVGFRRANVASVVQSDSGKQLPG